MTWLVVICVALLLIGCAYWLGREHGRSSPGIRAEVGRGQGGDRPGPYED